MYKRQTWECPVAADRPGAWTFRVEGWSDPYATWEHDATIKVRAGVDVELMLEEGARLLERARDGVERTEHAREVLTAGAARLRDTGVDTEQRLAGGTGDAVRSEPVSYTHLDVYKRQT